MALWTPADIATALWIDFADQSTLFDAVSDGSTVTNGVGIARAEDKSGNGRNFTESSSGNRPTWTSGVQNGLGIARYDGNDRLTSVAAASTWTFLHSTKSTIFVVVKNGTTSNPSAVYGWLGNSASTSSNRGVAFLYDNRNLISPTGLDDAFNCICSNAGGVISYASVNAASTAIVSDFQSILTANAYQFYALASDAANATAASRIKIGVNGGSLVGNNERTGGTSNNSPTFNLQIGAVGNNVVPLIGDYCELIIVNGSLSTSDRQKAEGYLAHKWGLTANLPSDHPYKNNPPDDTFDPDAAAYITAVETADAASLPTHIKNAINDFVVGAKADGFWSAIKAACFLAGPATLNGALVPLVGPAPTNVSGNFVSGDYNQTTGLISDGSTKYLDSNRNNNADPQNSVHHGVYLSDPTSAVNYVPIGAGFNLTGATRCAVLVGNNTFSVRIRSSSAISPNPATAISGASFFGYRRSSSSAVQLRASGTAIDRTQTSETPFSGNVFIFADNNSGSATAFFPGRLSWYSIGESLNLAQLDARLTTYMAAIATPGFTPSRRRRELSGGLL
jgi:hypothetical protein